MIEEGLRYPFQDDEAIKKGVLGSLLFMASIFVIPAFTFLGYLIRVMREDSIPEFDNFVDMTVEGFQAALILTAYLGVPIVIVSVFDSGIALIGVLLMLVIGYSLYSVFYELANNGWKAAFSIQVFKNAFTLDYFIGFIAVFFISNIIGILWIFSLVFLITILLLPAVYFYQYLFSFRIMTEAIESN